METTNRQRISSDRTGTEANLARLMRIAQSGQMVHALIFSGPEGTGKRTAAETLTRALLCSAKSDRPCGVCPSCKKVLSRLHPDVHYVSAEKNTIRVEQIRGLIEELSLTAHEGGSKIAIIEGAEKMNPHAQNALLKTLEEPTGDVVFFLLTGSAGMLLPTILSRCLQVRFKCLEVEDCARILEEKGIDAQKARFLSAAARGSVGRALSIDADEAYQTLRESVIAAVEGLQKASGVLEYAAKIGDKKERQNDVLEIMESWAYDLMRVQNSAEPYDIENLSRLRRSQISGSGFLQLIQKARRQLAANLSWTNVLDTIGMELIRMRH